MKALDKCFMCLSNLNKLALNYAALSVSPIFMYGVPVGRYEPRLSCISSNHPDAALRLALI